MIALKIVNSSEDIGCFLHKFDEEHKEYTVTAFDPNSNILFDTKYPLTCAAWEILTTLTPDSIVTVMTDVDVQNEIDNVYVNAVDVTTWEVMSNLQHTSIHQ